MELITAMIVIGLFSSSNITILEPNRISITDVWEAQFEGVEYVLYKYDCKDFTEDFYDTINGHGLDVSKMYGTLDGYLHYWLEIDGRYFEATTGRWVTDMDRYAKAKRIGRCW